ncbi:GMC family oxidoreductase [Phormidesmis priestleyi ULC007]|uniref:GMC family oxidoreductase n=1 Tax=Phormidesmis priestleyi ULC007 TaxID=1920490 RepID=A0A2T1D5H1_9CYAN|nr:GMC family oxidoreductase [Phormidesmis priestleyi]PSB15697.1 GMC family oxidoreductase [Phormidesmis priestleyi ULC007]PZO45953.1 MAG: GMC family oxidoreductase [Phormidesmis priestleyi]
MSEHYDIIIIGTGAGGGTITHRLAPTGKKILVLERGSFLRREKANWDTVQVVQKDRYHTKEVWRDKDEREIHPGIGYFVGGNTKVYGGALFRWREQDFDQVTHKGGISPEWQLKYRDFEPYYIQAEKLYDVHGQRGLDPTEPTADVEYPFAAIEHEPRIEELHQSLQNKGLHPFYLPLSIKLNQVNRRLSACIQCDTCDGFPCLVDAKADADINCIRPAEKFNNLTLMTEAKALRLHTSPSGREVTAVSVEINGTVRQFSGDIVIVACGAINSAALLLRSANEQHPQGLANSSDQVGRNFMKHQNGAIIGVSRKANPTVFQKTMGINDFYWGEEGFDYPMGHVQLLGKVNADMIAMESPSIAGISFQDRHVFEALASHSVDWWLTAEDLPDPNNRVQVKNDTIHLHYTENNTAAYDRLLHRWIETMKAIGCGDRIIPCSFYFKKKLPIQGVAHQCGTCRFGDDSTTSVLDLNCRTHDVDNLYVVDGSFFRSSAAVNPTLTIIANALRVADHLIDRLN